MSLTGGRSEKENNRRIKKFKEAGGKMLRNSIERRIRRQEEIVEGKVYSMTMKEEREAEGIK